MPRAVRKTACVVQPGCVPARPVRK